MTTASPADVVTPDSGTSVARRLSTLDRFLPLWIFTAMVLGIALGRVFPGLGSELDRVQVAGVSVPIGIGLLWMMYPVLAKVRYESIGRRMRYALISDIHANLPALDAVLADIDRRGDVDAIYHLGDLVGYSSFPNEIVSRLRERGIAGVAGNYDSTVATGYKHCGCRSESPRQEELAHISYEYTRAAVTPATRRALAALPFSLDLRPLAAT
jgi:hypothetical protein